MNAASSGSEVQGQQANADTARLSSQLDDGAEGSEQSEIKMDLKTSYAQLKDLVNEFHKGRFGRNCDFINTCFEHRAAKREAGYLRLEASIQDPMLIDLDSATASTVPIISRYFNAHNDALDACYRALTFIRTELAAVEKIKQMCSQVLELVDGTPESDEMKSETLVAAAEAERERKRFHRQLEHLN